MSEIIISATIEMRDEAAVQAALAGGVPYIVGARSQAGCIAYVWAQDNVHPNRICVYERWADAAALERHFANHHYTDMRDHIGASGIVAASSEKYEVARAAPVYGADGKASAQFPD